jgi:hypothetical protein
MATSRSHWQSSAITPGFNSRISPVRAIYSLTSANGLWGSLAGVLTLHSELSSAPVEDGVGKQVSWWFVSRSTKVRDLLPAAAELI